MQHPLHAKILSLAAPLAGELNLDIWGLEIIGSGRLLLRLYVESNGKITAPVESAPSESDSESAQNESVTLEVPQQPAGSADDDFGQDPPVGEQGVSIEECARLSRRLGFILETEDFIPNAYTLEVSSPGLERVFFTAEQILPYVGQRLSLALNKSQPGYPTEYHGRKNFIGTIKPLAPEQDKDSLGFLPDDGPEPGTSPILLAVPWSEVKKAHLIYDFEAGKGKKRSQKD